MNNEQIQVLKRLAEDATPGPWFYQEESDAYTHIIRPTANPGRIVASGVQTSAEHGEPTGRFIAAANPAAVLELIAIAERATPAAASAGEAGTIDTPSIARWTFEAWKKPDAEVVRDPDGELVKYADHLQNVAAARQQGWKQGMDDAITLTKPIAAERDAALAEVARLRAATAPVSAVPQEGELAGMGRYPQKGNQLAFPPSAGAPVKVERITAQDRANLDTFKADLEDVSKGVAEVRELLGAPVSAAEQAPAETGVLEAVKILPWTRETYIEQGWSHLLADVPADGQELPALPQARFAAEVDPAAAVYLVSEYRAALAMRQPQGDYTMDERDLARRILTFMGRATSGSNEPGADPLADRLAVKLAEWGVAAKQAGKE